MLATELASFLGQLVERCTGIAKVTSSNPVQAWMFFSGLIFTTAQVVFITAKISFIFMYKFYRLLIGSDCSIPSYETVVIFPAVCLNPLNVVTVSFNLACLIFAEPLLVLIEYVPFGDLVGYLRKSRGLNDTYYKDPDIKPQTNLTSQQLMKFAWQIADGMSYLSSKFVS